MLRHGTTLLLLVLRGSIKHAVENQRPPEEISGCAKLLLLTAAQAQSRLLAVNTEDRSVLASALEYTLQFIHSASQEGELENPSTPGDRAVPSMFRFFIVGGAEVKTLP